MDEVLNQSTDVGLAPAGSEASSAPQEKMIPQSQVNEIVGRVKQEEKAKREEILRSQEQYRQQAAAPQQASSRESVSDDYVRRIIAEEAARYRNEAQAQADEQAARRIVDTFHGKLEAGKQKYEDFDKLTGDLDFRRFPNTVQMLAEHLDNAHDVLYELSKNRAKMAQIEMTARDFPQEALYDLRRLGDSVRKNEEATSTRQANAPLSQQRPSNVGTDSGSVLSMRDLKAKYRV